jgi:hypothetical protein
MPRTLAILLPNGRTEYWFTDRMFIVDDKFNRNGVTWIVTSVGESDGKTKHATVTVRELGEPLLPPVEPA